jgi:hypothetical protein
VQLILLHPEVADRVCQHCLDFAYNDETGEVELGRDGEPERRPKTIPAPCRRFDGRGKPVNGGCPKGTPEEPRSLSPKNAMAYQHWRECRAIGEFPRDASGLVDAWVRKNATIIQDVEDGVREVREIEFRQTLLTLATLAARPTGG